MSTSPALSPGGWHAPWCSSSSAVIDPSSALVWTGPPLGRQPSGDWGRGMWSHDSHVTSTGGTSQGQV